MTLTCQRCLNARKMPVSMPLLLYLCFHILHFSGRLQSTGHGAMQLILMDAAAPATLGFILKSQSLSDFGVYKSIG
jgi:hypothetical protein